MYFPVGGHGEHVEQVVPAAAHLAHALVQKLADLRGVIDVVIKYFYHAN